MIAGGTRTAGVRIRARREVQVAFAFPRTSECDAAFERETGADCVQAVFHFFMRGRAAV
jgi:hypothetical protein